MPNSTYTFKYQSCQKQSNPIAGDWHHSRRIVMDNSLTTEKKETLLLSAFSELIESNKLKAARDEIEKNLNSFIKYVKKQFHTDQKLFESVESRKKSEESFLEKIYRKDYIFKWNISEDQQSNIILIAKKLPDLLGFRINCFFIEDEKQIYDAVQQYYNDHLFGDDFELDFTENLVQQNGHIIYKFSGLYKDQFHFEVQIKSALHNIWGEVEHKTIYKSQNYDVTKSTKKTITEEIFNILNASDQQLQSLFRSETSIKELVRALFFQLTKDSIAKKCKTQILASHYKGFFQLFDSSYELEKKYSALSLLGKDYTRKTIPEVSSSYKVNILKEKITSGFYQYYLLCQYNIFELLYEDVDYDIFLTILSDTLFQRFMMDDTEDPFANENFIQDAFDDEDDVDSHTEDNNYEEVLIKLNDMIGGRIK